MTHVRLATDFSVTLRLAPGAFIHGEEKARTHTHARAEDIGKEAVACYSIGAHEMRETKRRQVVRADTNTSRKREH